MTHPISFIRIVVVIIIVLPISNATSNKNISTMQLEVPGKLDLGNPYIADTAMTIAKDYPGEYSINQVCAIYNTLAGGWYYYSEANDVDYFQNANLTLQRGKISDTIGRGDCDDFAILMASLVESLGGSTRITFAWDGQSKSGHAYTEVYLGRKGDPNVDDLVGWIKGEYGLGEIPGLNRTGNEVWLNIDWGSDPKKPSYPGGPYFGNNSKSIMKVFIREPSSKASPRIVPVIDSMDSAAGWDLIRDDKGSSINANTTSIKKGLVLQLNHDLKKDGWAGISKEIDPKVFSEITGINFPCYTMGSPNSIELRLLYEDGTAFGFSWNSLDREKWLSLKALFSNFRCLYPEKNCQAYRNKLDTTKVKRMEFVVFNDPDEGDKLGPGTVLIDRVQGAMAIPVGSPWAKAEEQRERTKALELASQSELIRNDPERLTESVLLAVESLRRHKTLAGDLALRRGLALLPHLDFIIEQDYNINAIAFSPQGNQLATAGSDGKARILDAITGQELKSFSHDDSVRDVAFSPNGTLLATASNDGTARIWDIRSGSERFHLSHESSVNGIDFSHHSMRLASASSDGTARIWDVNTGEELKRFDLDWGVADTKFSPDDSLLATGSNNFARIWDINTSQELSQMIHDNPIKSMAFSPDGNLLATASDEGKTIIWEISTNRELFRVVHSDMIMDVEFSPDGTCVATASIDDTARIWDIITGKEVFRLNHNASVTGLAFSPDGRLLATSSFDYKIKTWDIRRGKELLRLNHNASVGNVAFSPDGSLLASSCSDGTLRIWKTDTGQEVSHIDHGIWVYDISFSPDGKLLATGDNDYTARIWEAQTGRELTRFYFYPPSDVSAVSFSPNSLLLAAAGYGTGYGICEIWNVNTRKEIRHLFHNETVNDVCFSPDGQHIATGSSDGIARIWDINTGQEILKLRHVGTVEKVAFSPDGSLLATSCYGDIARVWNSSTGKELYCLSDDDSAIDIAFSQDGSLLVTIDGNTVRIRDAKTGKEVQRIEFDDVVTDAAISPDKNSIAIANGLTVRISMLSSEGLIREACYRLTRNLTREEWREHLGNKPYRETCNC